jgi:amino acid transporter
LFHAWHDQYQFKGIHLAPEGTRLSATISYDNSADNPRNPSSPTRRVRWGGDSNDETIWASLWLLGDISLVAADAPKTDWRLIDRACNSTGARNQLGESRMEPQPPRKHDHKSELQRRFGLLQATALNMSNMIGIGPFITIPLLMTALGGPQAMLGWLVALLIAIPDGMVWSELGAAMPGSGGSYLYLREGFGRERFGRLMAFLFIWQFILSGPLEIASGYIGLSSYLTYVWPEASGWGAKLIAASAGVLNIALLYRRITSIGKITVSLWIGTMLTTTAVMGTGALHFDPRVAFDFPPGAFNFSFGFFLGLGAAARVGIYDYLGYYDVCYIGEEVKEPGRVIPRSIIISVIAVALIYAAINLSIIGVVPWRQFVPAEETKPLSDFVVSAFMERVYGSQIATIFTAMVVWTAFGSVFALLLGYSRVPYAAATDGYFFKVFGRLHPKKNFPHISLVVIGMIAILCSFFSLGLVIDALITTRILVQFVGQIFAVMLLRKHKPRMNRPYKIWLYPLPNLIALVGWIFIFATSDWKLILFGLGTLGLGVIVFLIWSWRARRCPLKARQPRTRE